MKATRVLAAALGALTGVAVLAALVAGLRLGWSWVDALDAFVVTNAVMGLAFASCGVILAWHRPRNAIGWLFVSGGLLQAVAASVPPVQSLFEQSATNPAVLRAVHGLRRSGHGRSASAFRWPCCCSLMAGRSPESGDHWSSPS